VAKLDKLVQAAGEHLQPGEQVLASVLGTYVTRLMGSETVRTGSMLATDRRVVFYAKKLGGYELESFPYGSISSFEQGKGLMGHTMTFFASGNTVHMKWIKDLKDMAAFTEAVKERMNGSAAAAPAGLQNAGQAPAAPPAPAAPAQPAQDPIEQLRRLGELRDAGIVTPEEFAAKKAELLGRL
jgi:hypothetical protein